MSDNADMRLIQEHDGRWAARSNSLPTCIGYGRTEREARAEFDLVFRELTEAGHPPRLVKGPGEGWSAWSTQGSCSGIGKTPAEAIADLRREEALEFGADFEDWSHHGDGNG